MKPFIHVITFYACVYLSSAPSFAGYKDHAGCLKDLDTIITSQTKEQTDHFGPIRKGNESVFLPGSRTDEAVLIVHGYIASPFEVKALGEKINTKGYTVFMPLLPGFGTSVESANQVRWEEWTASIKNSFMALRACYPKVSVGGFSLGASVVSYLATHDDEFLANLGSLSLFGPALRLKNRFFLDIASPFFFLFGYSINVEKGNAFLEKIKNHDLQIPNRYPEFYNDEMPLRAAHLRLDEFEEAKSALLRAEKCTAFSPHHQVLAQFYLAVAESRLGNPEQSKQRLESVIQSEIDLSKNAGISGDQELVSLASKMIDKLNHQKMISKKQIHLISRLDIKVMDNLYGWKPSGRNQKK